MNRTDLLEVLAGGESSRVEFKRDDVQPGRLAAEIAALLNHEAGSFCSVSKTTATSQA